MLSVRPWLQCTCSNLSIVRPTNPAQHSSVINTRLSYGVVTCKTRKVSARCRHIMRRSVERCATLILTVTFDLLVTRALGNVHDSFIGLLQPPHGDTMSCNNVFLHVTTCIYSSCIESIMFARWQDSEVCDV